MAQVPKTPTPQATKAALRPLHDRLLVRRVEEGDDKRGGIIIPDTAKEKPQEGEVIAVGPGRSTDDGKRMPLEVKKGDRILFGKYSGTEVTSTAPSISSCCEEDVLAVLSDDRRGLGTVTLADIR